MVNHLFQGLLRSQVKCEACGHESNTYDPFMDLSLEVKGCESLRTALDRFTQVGSRGGCAGGYGWGLRWCRCWLRCRQACKLWAAR